MLGPTNTSANPSIILNNVTAACTTAISSASDGADYDLYQQGYRYYCAIPVTGATASMMGEVVFGDADARSGNFAPICRTYTDQLRIYSKTSATASNVTVMIKSIIENIFEIDATPTSGSTNPITSGGVYNAVLPRNGIGYHLCVFGSNIFEGYYRAWFSMPNADKVTVELIGMGVIGESWWTDSTLTSKTQIFTDAWGVYINCNDSSVVGRACNPQIRVSGGSD